MEIGRYYHSNHQYLAAINRFRNVIESYQTTTHVRALHRLTEAYLSLGIDDEARKTAAVLGHFPGSEWYVNSYQFIEGKTIRTEEEAEVRGGSCGNRFFVGLMLFHLSIRDGFDRAPGNRFPERPKRTHR